MPTRSASSARFESLAFQVEPPPGTSAAAAARSVLRRRFPGETWSLRPLNEATGEFEALPGVARSRRAPRKGRQTGARRITVGGAWDRAYRLQADPAVVYAEPLFEIADDQQYPPPPSPRAVARRPRAVRADENDDAGTANRFEWSLDTLRVKEAWALFGTRTPGAGIVVGHPDTGYTPHPEIMGPRLRTADGFDFVDERPDPLDPLSGGFLRNPGHGTSTSSVIISGPGVDSGNGSGSFVSGIAPGASLIPIRTTPSVVLWSMSGLTRAIRHAIDKRVHVVSISLGGPFPSVALKNAMQDAEREGVIVLCAAGNQVRFVVFPAAFDEVIAVAASRIDDGEWDGSCRGPAVDITAPGSSVWRARAEKQGSTTLFDVRRGSGTSYAVAATAGLAALWLSFHGRQALIDRYGKHRLAAVFKELLQQTSRTPSGWDTDDFGPGIGHAKRLLEAPLPDMARATGLRGIRRRAVSAGGPLDVLVHQLAPSPRSGVVAALADLLDVTEDALPETLDAVGAELAMQVGTDPALRARLRAAAETRAPRTRPRGAAPRRRPRAAAVTITTARRRLEDRPLSRRLRAQLR